MRPWKFPFLLVTAAIAGEFAAASAPARPAVVTFECRWAETPPVIDGRGDDPWLRAIRVDDFRQSWRPGSPAAKEGTRARLLWDREWLYFFAEMDDRDVSADVREHDGALWENDVFELFLKPSEKHAGYYEFEVNPFGAVLDGFLRTARSRDDFGEFKRDAFHVEARTVVRGTLNVPGDRDAGWSVEGRIPWSDFNAAGGRPAPGETWRVNLSRVNGAGAAGEFSSAAPLTELNFHQTEAYARLHFIGPEQRPRARWENTRLEASPDGPSHYAAVRAWPGLKALSLVALVPSPDGEWIWFVEQEPGWDGRMKLRRLRAGGDGGEAELLLEIDGLAFSVAFHPRFAENGFVYLGVNGPRDAPPRHSAVVRYAVRDGRPDAASRTVIIEWPSDGHNGAALAFAGDGMLFVTSGDGTNGGDPDHSGQDPLTLRAKVLRIDVDHPADGKSYSVPRDNPFVGDGRFAPETWAYGLRNPWRLTWDPVSGQLWVGENGEDGWEMARLVQRGANYGWSVFEGGHPFAQDRPLGPHPVTFPTLEFSHAEFRSLTGGVVYRGRKFPELTGAYVFGDFATGRVWAAKHNGTKVEWSRELVDTPFALTHVTVDAAGELLLADYGSPVDGVEAGSGIYRLERASAPASPPPEFPRQLSAAGLFSDVKKLTPLPGVLRYEINAPGWHDGASSEHHLALPGDAVIEIRPAKSWQAPNGAVLAQTLILGGQRIETRVLVKRQNDCAGYTYIWNAAQTDATLADKAGADIELPGGQPWRIPSRTECMTCHSRQANFCLTLHDAQLNRDDQLVHWERLGLLRANAPAFEEKRASLEKRPPSKPSEPEQRRPALSPLLPCDPGRLRRFAAVGDARAGLELRARSYLGVNCAHCHTVSGGGNSAMDFDWLLPTREMHAIGERPQHGDFGLADAKVIAPGAAALSVIVPRIAQRGPGQMPPLGTRISDAEGIRLLAQWIESLPK